MIIPVTLFSPDGVQSATFDARLDPSFGYCLVPGSILLRLGIDPEKDLAVALPARPAGADAAAPTPPGLLHRLGGTAANPLPGTLAVLPAARAHLESAGRRTSAWCLFAEEDIQPVLGTREP